MNVRDYLESLLPELADKIKVLMVNKRLGLHTQTDPADDCRCTHVTPNGHCAKIDGNCVWIPDLG